MLDPEVLKARKAVNQYKELNTGTVEKLSKYDPISKSWIFEKVKVDPRAKEFKAAPEKKKPVKQKKQKLKPVNPEPKPKPKAVKVPPAKKKREKTYVPTPGGTRMKVVDLFKEGKNVKDIAGTLGINLVSVYRHLKREGLTIPKYQPQPTERYLQIKAMMEKGMTTREIKKATGLKSLVHYYINEIRRKENL